MKRLLVTTSLALSLCCGAAFAQQTADPQQTAPANPGYHHRHAPNPQRQAEFLSKKLNLTADQTSRLEPILAAQDQQMQALWQNTQLSPQDRHQQMRAIHQQTEQQLSTVLNPDQLAQLKAMHHRGWRHNGQNGQNGQAPSA